MMILLDTARQSLKQINDTITNNSDLQKIIPEIKKVAEFIKLQKQKKNITKVIQQCMNSKIYSQMIQKLKNLEICLKKKINSIKPFPSNKIYFNPLSVQEGSHSIALIIIPQGLEFSLHDHKDMLVLTKVLFGQIQVESMDIDQNYDKLAKTLRLDFQENLKVKNSSSRKDINLQKNLNILKLIFQNPYGPDSNYYTLYKNFMNPNSYQTQNWKKYLLKQTNLDIITPNKGNIHRLYAKTDCIILDILLPDYISEQHCNFYQYISNEHQRNPRIMKVKTSKQAYYLSDLRDYVKQQSKQIQKQKQNE